ncbi:hypothetical protein JCM30394_14200 [Deferrisoma palaeochoriense]
MLLVSLALSLPAGAEIYRWTGPDGTVHFTDNLEQVPPDQRPRVRTLDDRLPPPRAPDRVPLEDAGAGYLVDVRIDGRGPVRLVLDTGATSTVVSPEAARRVGLRVRTDPPVELHTAGGKIRAGWAEVRSLEVGGRSRGPLKVVVHDAVPGADGLLGMDFLGAFRVELRSDGPSLVLHPR